MSLMEYSTAELKVAHLVDLMAQRWGSLMVGKSDRQLVIVLEIHLVE